MIARLLERDHDELREKVADINATELVDLLLGETRQVIAGFRNKSTTTTKIAARSPDQPRGSRGPAWRCRHSHGISNLPGDRDREAVRSHRGHVFPRNMVVPVGDAANLQIG